MSGADDEKEPSVLKQLLAKARVAADSGLAEAGLGEIPQGIRRGTLPAGAATNLVGVGNTLGSIIADGVEASALAVQFACTGRVPADERRRLLKGLETAVQRSAREAKGRTELHEGHAALQARFNAMESAESWCTAVVHCPVELAQRSTGLPKPAAIERLCLYTHESVVLPVDAALRASELVTTDPASMDKVQAQVRGLEAAHAVASAGRTASSAVMAGIRRAIDEERTSAARGSAALYVVADPAAPSPVASGHPSAPRADESIGGDLELSASDLPVVRRSVHGSAAERTDMGLFDANTGLSANLDAVRRHFDQVQNAGQLRLQQLFERNVPDTTVHSDITLLLVGVYGDRSLLGYLPGFIVVLRNSLKYECPRLLGDYKSHAGAKGAHNYALEGWTNIIADFTEKAMRILHLMAHARRAHGAAGGGRDRGGLRGRRAGPSGGRAHHLQPRRPPPLQEGAHEAPPRQGGRRRPLQRGVEGRRRRAPARA